MDCTPTICKGYLVLPGSEGSIVVPLVLVQMFLMDTLPSSTVKANAINDSRLQTFPPEQFMARTL